MPKNKPAKILVVDDDAAHRFMLKTMLHKWGWHTDEADDGKTAVEAVHGQPFDAILMDVRMANMDGMEALKKIHQYNPAIPIIIMTAYSSIDSAVEAIKIGAQDYLQKPLDFDRLRLVLEAALDHRRVAQKIKKHSGANERPINKTGIIGESPSIQKLLEEISYVAPTDATALIVGESGTGKELVAEALYTNSNRTGKPFIKVNCAAIVETLLESELFGHEKGAFTGADRRRDGKFMQADHGTIFLDEIGEMSPAMQAKLLRVLQDHEVQRVGGPETIKIDVRVIAATNRKLDEEVAAGKFREDLYYRLNVVALNVPSLSERPEDIPLLAEHFLKKYAEKNNRRVNGITPQCMDRLLNYPWPGNVRELENAIERGVILMRSDYLDEKNMPISILKWAAKQWDSPQTSPASLEEAEREVIVRTLGESGGNKSETARRLNITRKTLQAKINKYGIEN